jgi:hypothetical protein
MTERISVNPIVAVVGRPNVGKSTLVNRIVGRRETIVEEKPGVTRDRKVLEAEWNGRRFIVVDTGGWIDTDEPLAKQVSLQAERAIREADLVIHVLDVTVGVTEDEELHPGRREQLGDGLGGLLGPVVQRPGAADPEQVLEAGERLDVLAVDRNVEADLVDPGEPFLGVLTPGVALVLEVLVEPAQLGGKFRFHHDLVAAHVDDVVDVLDVHRALLDACPAGGARPQHIGVDHAERCGITHQWTGGLQR